MTKRAKYNGPHDEVRVAVLNQGDVYTEKYVTVVRGGLLPTETDDGENVPASVRDDLIQNNPDFSEVNQADQKPTEKKDGEK
jgi:hypothetical protein